MEWFLVENITIILRIDTILRFILKERNTLRKGVSTFVNEYKIIVVLFRPQFTGLNKLTMINLSGVERHLNSVILWLAEVKVKIAVRVLIVITNTVKIELKWVFVCLHIFLHLHQGFTLLLILVEYVPLHLFRYSKFDHGLLLFIYKVIHILYLFILVLTNILLLLSLFIRDAPKVQLLIKHVLMVFILKFGKFALFVS